ncbi:YjgB family protein [Paenibacillus solisilvae]|uniref:YjgB family protein n=1 Tax=Paenibacillus solisilvae TaxID=2486751 RepID=A0ABW0VVV1_9BACL
MLHIKNKALRKWSKVSLAAMISLGALATVSPVSAAVGVKTETAATAAVKNSTTAYVKSILALAKQGKVPGSTFVSGKTLISEIHKKWGDPTSSGNGYEFYNFGMGAGAYAVGVNKKGVVYDLRNFGQAIDPTVGIKSLTFTSVITALGMPKEIRFIGTDKIYLYSAGDRQLKFVGPKTPVKGKAVHIDHINVYSPKAD